MPLPITIPNTFANATATIPLSQLDNNFSTVAVAVNSIGNGAFTLANAQITGGTISNVTLDNVSVDVETLSNVTITNLTVNGNATLTNATVTANVATITTANVTTANVTNMVTGNATITGGTINVTSVIATDDVTVGDDLVFTGTGNRITGDFTNATVANWVAFQTSTTNGSTTVSALPNGTSVTSAMRAYNNSDPTNASFGQMVINSNEVRVVSGITGTGTYLPMTFYTGGSERMRVDTSGNLLVGTTTDNVATAGFRVINSASDPYLDMSRTGSASARMIGFYRNSSGSLVGQITTTSTATTYATSSDYRLKHDIQPMSGALAKVAALKPCTYTWKSDGSAGQGFIAHELQAVVPDAVTGEKDGEEMQGVDYGKITPLLTAALQEAIAEIKLLKARVAELEEK